MGATVYVTLALAREFLHGSGSGGMTGFLIACTVNNHGAGKHQWDVTITDISEFNHVSVRASVPVFRAN